MLATILLYMLNNYVLKKATDGWIRYLLICHFNDFICPLFFLSYVNTVLLTANREITSLPQLLLLCFAAGLCWEFLAPVVKRASVADIMDLVSYLLGSVLYWRILDWFIKYQRRCKYEGT